MSGAAWRTVWPGRVLALTLSLALGASLVGCAPRPQESAADTTPAGQALVLQAGERRYLIDARASQLLVYTYRGGKLARFGHNHVLSARALAGEVALAGELSGSRFRLEVPFADIEVDDPELRRAAGADFDSKPSPEDVAATRDNMLGPDGLDIEVAPGAVIEGTVTQASSTRVTLDMRVTVRNKTHRQPVEAEVSVDGDALRISGATQLRHSDFGIEPFSVMLGALTVEDVVDVKFELVARPAT